jgi:hypothetical protein
MRSSFNTPSVLLSYFLYDDWVVWKGEKTVEIFNALISCGCFPKNKTNYASEVRKNERTVSSRNHEIIPFFYFNCYQCHPFSIKSHMTIRLADITD